MNELHLFAGAGGGILAGHLLGNRCVCAVECEPYAQAVLVARQNDGTFPPFPIWDDVRTFDGKTWRGVVDVVCGGFPCQDISTAGKGAGITGEKSGLWVEMARIVGEVQPKYVFVENSPALTRRGINVVLGDLASLGYDAEWGCLSAGEVGANHKRERIWILGYADSNGKSGQPVNDETPRLREFRQGNDANADMPQRQGGELPSRTIKEDALTRHARWWEDSSSIHRMDDGVANRIHRLKAIGNGQVPTVAVRAFTILMSKLG